MAGSTSGELLAVNGLLCVNRCSDLRRMTCARSEFINDFVHFDFAPDETAAARRATGLTSEEITVALAGVAGTAEPDGAVRP
eukprot:SAG11_NODE_3378_length_2488_cov_11.156969_2_plen_82_part_00